MCNNNKQTQQTQDCVARTGGQTGEDSSHPTPSPAVVCGRYIYNTSHWTSRLDNIITHNTEYKNNLNYCVCGCVCLECVPVCAGYTVSYIMNTRFPGCAHVPIPW